jgi:hypothetical protein
VAYTAKKEKCALPFVQVAAMVECGTHAVVAAEIGKDGGASFGTAGCRVAFASGDEAS